MLRQNDLDLQADGNESSNAAMRHGTNEAFSRVLIDKALEFSGWNLLDQKQVRFELNGTNGRADYVLNGQRGPLCVIEAKKDDVDPYDAMRRGLSIIPDRIKAMNGIEKQEK